VLLICTGACWGQLKTHGDKLDMCPGVKGRLQVTGAALPCRTSKNHDGSWWGWLEDKKELNPRGECGGAKLNVTPKYWRNGDGLGVQSEWRTK